MLRKAEGRSHMCETLKPERFSLALEDDRGWSGDSALLAFTMIPFSSVWTLLCEARRIKSMRQSKWKLSHQQRPFSADIHAKICSAITWIGSRTSFQFRKIKASPLSRGRGFRWSRYREWGTMRTVRSSNSGVSEIMSFPRKASYRVSRRFCGTAKQRRGDELSGEHGLFHPLLAFIFF